MTNLQEPVVSTLPSPPGARVVTLPRERGDQLQEPAVAVSPRDAKHVFVSYHQTVGEGGDHHPDVRVDAHVASSTDGGETWTVAENTTHPGYPVSIDATIGCDLDGRAYLVYIGMEDLTLTTRNGEYVVRSLGDGRWEAPVALAEHPGGEQVFEHISFFAGDNHPDSPRAGNVYIVWTRNYYGAAVDEILVSRSSDRGESWSEPRVIAHGGFALGTGVGSDGALYVMHVSFDEGVTNPSWDHGWHADLLVSTDGGETFDTPRPMPRPSDRPNPYGFGPGTHYEFARAFGWPVLGVDPRGTGCLYVVWGDWRNGDRDIFCATSTDAGRTWSEPVRVNDDPIGTGRDQLTQCVGVDPVDGSVNVLFYDRRNDPENKLPTVTLARSADGGKSFTNYSLSDTPLDPTAACLGDYIGIAARDGRVYAAWLENVPDDPQPPKQTETVVSGTLELQPGGWPYGPSAIRIGIADFRSS